MFCWRECSDERKAHPKPVRTEGMFGFICKSCAEPDVQIKEMVADWAGAGRAITGKWSVAQWYEKNRDNIMLPDATRVTIELMLATYFDYELPASIALPLIA